MRRYEASSNAQRLFAESVDHYTTLTVADTEANKILYLLTDFKFGKNYENHTTSEFITYWVEQFQQIEDSNRCTSCYTREIFSDIVYSDTTEIEDGSIAAELYSGRVSHVNMG